MRVFDYKITTWERIRIPDDITDEQLLKIVNKITSPDDLLDHFPNSTVEKIEECDEHMEIGDIQDSWTQEILKDGKQIWNNKKTFE